MSLPERQTDGQGDPNISLCSAGGTKGCHLIGVSLFREDFVPICAIVSNKSYLPLPYTAPLTKKKLYGTYMSKLYVKYRGHIIVKYMSHICILNVNEVEDI